MLLSTLKLIGNQCAGRGLLTAVGYRNYNHQCLQTVSFIRPVWLHYIKNNKSLYVLNYASRKELHMIIEKIRTQCLRLS